MKKICLLLMIAVLLLSAAACGGAAPEEKEAPAATVAPAEPVDMQALYDTMVSQMPEMIVLDETMMLNFCGITAGDCTQAVVATCADGLRTDELWLIEAADEAALENLKTLAETRLKQKGEESISYSPEQYAVVEKAQVIANGLYFAVIVSPDVDALAEIYHNAFG